MALTATIFLSLLGKEGLKEMATQCFQKTQFLKRELAQNPNISFPFSPPIFNEFVMVIHDAKKVLKKLAGKGILGGIALEDSYPKLKNHVLVSVTEKRTAQEIDLFKNLLGGLI